jgi:hypothetical protein
MDFQSSVYAPPLQDILSAAEYGHRPIPLLAKDASRLPLPAALSSAQVATLFPGAPHPDTAMAGLWMYFGRFEESHNIAQDIRSAEGSYWHALLHRQEPDNWNAKYWLRRVGAHPVHGTLSQALPELPAVQESGLPLPSGWDPVWFADLFDAAANDRNHRYRAAVEAIQLCEWQLLFQYCALPG